MSTTNEQDFDSDDSYEEYEEPSEQKSLIEILMKQKSDSGRIQSKEKGFSYKFDYVATIGKTGHKGDGNDEFNRPLDIVITQSRYLIIADSENFRVQVFTEVNSKWEYFTTIMTQGLSPQGLLLENTDQGETLWLDFSSNNTVYKFENISQFIVNVKNGIDCKPEIFDKANMNPRVKFQYNISNDKIKKRYILSEQYTHELQVHDEVRLFVFARGKGCGPGNDQLFNPHGSCFDYKHGYFLVTDSENHRVQIFE